MGHKIIEIIKHINNLADPGLAMSWDNIGLQIGLPESEAEKILLTLDVTENAIDYAIENKIDLIISHHPLIFRPLKKISDKRFIKLIKNDIAVFCAHTNLDVVKKGVNFALAEKLQLENLEFLTSETGSELYQVAVYIPQNSIDLLKDELSKQGAGIIGNYSSCMSTYEVQGQFKPEAGSDPVVGEHTKLEQVTEKKLEFFVESFKLKDIIKTIMKFHPYETPVYTVTLQNRDSDNFGLGLTGELKHKMKLKELANYVKSKLNAPYVKLWPADKGVDFSTRKIAVCGGSGTSLINQSYGKADVLISADFTYHTFLDSRLPLIDAGHFFTENPVLDSLKKYLSVLDLQIIEFPKKLHEINKLIII